MSEYREIAVVRGDTTGLITVSADGKVLTGDVGPDQWIIHTEMLEDARHQLDLCLTRFRRGGWDVLDGEMR